MGTLIGYSPEALEEINIRGIELDRGIAREYHSAETPMIVGGAIGPRGDAYQTGIVIKAASAEGYDSEQVGTLKKAGADMERTRAHWDSSIKPPFEVTSEQGFSLGCKQHARWRVLEQTKGDIHAEDIPGFELMSLPLGLISHKPLIIR